MPRDGSNVYSPPTGTSAVSGDTISSSAYNSFIQDLTADLNAARPISAGGTGATTAATAREAIGAAASDDRLLPFAAGVILPFAGAGAPTGWLLCYGQAVSRTTYAALFSALGTAWGAGDGSTTFNLPDLRGRVLAGKDDMGGTSANRLTNQTGGLDGDTLGATGGSETHTLTEGQLASHTHSFSATTSSGGAHVHEINFTGHTSHNTDGGGNIASGSNSAESITAFDTQSSGAHTHTVSGTSGSAGSGSAHNNVQPTAVVNFIIKT